VSILYARQSEKHFDQVIDFSSWFWRASWLNAFASIQREAPLPLSSGKVG
jgi:hypothetical protein